MVCTYYLHEESLFLLYMQPVWEKFEACFDSPKSSRNLWGWGGDLFIYLIPIHILSFDLCCRLQNEYCNSVSILVSELNF